MDVYFEGSPYHAYDYYFLDKEELVYMFRTMDINTAMSYIDGAFYIRINSEDETIHISDAFGLYPLFLNVYTGEVLSKLPPNSKTNSVYMDICACYDETYAVGYYTAPPIDHYMCVLDDWRVLEPNTIVRVNSKQIKTEHVLHNTSKEDPGDVYEHSIRAMCANANRPVTGLSMGVDTRSIVSVCKKLDVDLTVYTYGREQADVADYILPLLDAKTIPMPTHIEQSMYDTLYAKHLTDMNGMGNLPAKIHMFYVYEQLNDYDLYFETTTSNEYLVVHDVTSQLHKFANGIGHHTKHMARKGFYFNPIAQKRVVFNMNVVNYKRMNFLRSIIKNNYSELLHVPISSRDALLTKTFLVKRDVNLYKGEKIEYLCNKGNRFDYVTDYNNFMCNYE